MGLLNKIISLFNGNKTEKVYSSTDNLGTGYTDCRKADAAWQVQGMTLSKGSTTTMYFNTGEIQNYVSKGHPFLCFTFNDEAHAKNGISSISFIKKASDTNEFISLEILEYGCYETEKTGKWEVIIWGENLTIEMFNEAKSNLEKAGGVMKGERVPIKHSSSGPKPAQKPKGKASYVRTDRKGQNTYEIYKAPSKLVALDFLKGKTVTKALYFLIVETPEGNWGKDIDGIYQE
jgi:hypothetical protein